MSVLLPDPQYLAPARSFRAPTAKCHDGEETLYQALMEASPRPSVALHGPECWQGASLAASTLHRWSHKCGAPPGQIRLVGYLARQDQGRSRMQHNHHWATLQGEDCFSWYIYIYNMKHRNLNQQSVWSGYMFNHVLLDGAPIEPQNWLGVLIISS